MLPLSIHSHIQWPILAEGESSFCLIHLHGGAASIQEDSINAAWPYVHVRQQDFKLAESAKQWFNTTTEERMEGKKMNMAIRHLYISHKYMCYIDGIENKCHIISLTSSVRNKKRIKYYSAQQPIQELNDWKKRIREKYIQSMCGRASYLYFSSCSFIRPISYILMQ